jgi:type IV pilus assembly protein PilM
VNVVKLPFLRRSPETFGLDIGSSAVKVVQLKEEGSARQLAAVGIAPLPPEAISDGTIKDPSVVVKAIKTAVEKAGVRASNATIGVSGRDLIIKRVQIPEVPAKELRDAVQLEAEHHIPFSIDEVFLDYHVVDRHDGAMDLILVAVKKSKVVEYVSLVEEAGLNAVVVDVDGFALGNQFELARAHDDGEAVALIDIGASIMKTNVLKGRSSIFARDIPFGGNNYTSAIAEHLKVPFEQAEAAKLNRDGAANWDAIVPALEAVSRDLSLEVQRTFDYFASTVGESDRIGKIILSGGCSQLPGLTEFLSSTWGIPVELARPFDGIDIDPGKAEIVHAAGPSLAVAVGLGLRRPGDKGAA